MRVTQMTEEGDNEGTVRIWRTWNKEKHHKHRDEAHTDEREVMIAVLEVDADTIKISLY